jgi:hypothetical protein
MNATTTSPAPSLADAAANLFSHPTTGFPSLVRDIICIELLSNKVLPF